MTTMSAATDYIADDRRVDHIAPYRAVSRSAVMGLVVACIALPLAVLTMVSAQSGYGGDAINLGTWTAMLSVFAVVLGGAGLLTIRRYPTEYTGKNLARAGLLMGLAQFALGVSLASYTYATEVPEGYTRVGFWELRPDPEEPLGLPISERAAKLNEQPIFIKGYIHPGVSGSGKVDHFILVPDMGTCCFGGQPDPWDMIEVFIKDKDQRVAYSTRTMKLAGQFAVAPTNRKAPGGLTDVWYHMQVDVVK